MGEHLRERFRQPGPKRILALDGGGARGLLTLGVLQKLEEELARRSGNPGLFRLAHYFDLIGGTSTGALSRESGAILSIRSSISFALKPIPTLPT